MPTFFAHRRGTVVRVGNLSGRGPSPFAIRMQGTGIGGTENPATRAIITQSAMTASVNLQLQHAVDETIWAYIFGDRIGELKVSGVCFANGCSVGPAGQVDGVSQLLRAYAAHRASAAGRTILVHLGTNVLRALLVGASIEITDPENELAQWGFRFMVLTGAQS